MAEHVCKMRIPLQEMETFPTPVALLGMKKKKSISLNTLEYSFEGDDGSFAEMLFDITDNGDDAFVIVKAVAIDKGTLFEYIKPYVELQETHPMRVEDIVFLDRTIVAKQVLKEKNDRIIDFFSKKRKGIYFGNFIDVKDTKQSE